MWPQFLHFLSTLIFPERCAGCQKYGTALCANCISTIPFSSALPLENIFAIYNYSSKVVQDIIWKCKYHHKTEAFEILVKTTTPYIAEYISEELLSEEKVDIIFVPIPQRRAKTNSRGFNQSALACDIISAQFQNSKVVHMLEKSRDTVPQARTHSRDERLQNVAHSMKTKNYIDQHYMKHSLCIVVDDVTTTGATLLEAMRALRVAGARHIFGVAIAHGYKRR